MAITGRAGPRGARGTRRSGVVLAAVLVAVAVGACRPKDDSPSVTPSHPAASAVASDEASRPPAGSAGFSIGLEYAVPGLADASAAVGATRAKPALEFGLWGNIEPREGQRAWGPMDTLVAEYQAAGFRDLQLLISADSPWAARTPKRDPMPRPEHLDAYGDFVAAFVERYDGDGIDDAPGLLAPVHEFGIERELTGFWPSSIDDYLALLDIAAPRIRAADPQAVILPIAIMAIDVFDGGPSPQEAEARWAVDHPFRHDRADVVALLDACDRYDAVDIHALGDAVELPATAEWIRAQLAEAGCPDLPIWAGDAFPMSPLVAFDQRPFAPATAADRPSVGSWLGAAADPGDRDHAAAVAWLEREMAIGSARKVALAALAGLAGINIGNLEDWTTGLAPADRLLVAGAGTDILGGIQDRTVGLRSPGGPLPYEGQFFSRERTPGASRPSFGALALCVTALDGATAVERVPSDIPGLWLLHAATPAGQAWIAWLDDGRLHLPGDAGPAPVALDVAVGAGVAGVHIATVPTTRTELPPTFAPVATSAGHVTVDVGRAPVVILVP